MSDPCPSTSRFWHQPMTQLKHGETQDQVTVRYEGRAPLTVSIVVFAYMAHRFVAKSRFGATSSSALSSGDPREAVSCGLHVSGRDSGKASGPARFEATQSASHSSGNPRVLAPALGSVAPSAKLGRGATASQPHDDAPWFPSKRPRLSLVETAPQPTPLDSRISLQISKAITGFARYPHKRPRGLHSDYDGSLDIDEIWKHWGRHHGVSKRHMLQFISEHAFSSEGRRRFLLRSDHDGRTWVSVTRSLRRFSKRRRQCGCPGASRTLATARDGDDDMLSISSGCSLEAVQATGSTEVKSEPSSPAPGSHQEPAVPPTLLCKEEVPASIPLTCPLPDSSDPVHGFTDPLAGPGLLDGFSFLLQRPTTSVARSSLVTSCHLSRTRSRIPSSTLSQAHWKASPLTRCYSRKRIPRSPRTAKSLAQVNQFLLNTTLVCLTRWLIPAALLSPL